MAVKGLLYQKTRDMTEEEKDCEGLVYLRWSQFDDPTKPGSGKKFMERDTVQILDRVVHKTKMVLNIELAYVTPQTAEIKGLISTDSHRIGKAVRIRLMCPKKRMRLVSALIGEGVRRIAVGMKTVYYDTDDQKKESLYIW